jgi:hypothetical protein
MSLDLDDNTKEEGKTMTFSRKLWLEKWPVKLNRDNALYVGSFTTESWARLCLGHKTYRYDEKEGNGITGVRLKKGKFECWNEGTLLMNENLFQSVKIDFVYSFLVC